jgi:ABC-type multidrug transport system fused ATPase/permease subunit
MSLPRRPLFKRTGTSTFVPNSIGTRAGPDTVLVAQSMTATGVAGQPDLRGPTRFLYWLARCQRGRVMLGATYGSAWMITLALPPYLLSKAIDDGLRVKDSGALLEWAGALLAVGILNAGLAIGRHRTMTRVRLDATFRITQLTVDHVTRLGANLSRRVTPGEVVAIGLSDVTTISTALTVTGPGIGAVIAYAVVGALLWTVSGLLAVVVLLGVPVLAVVVGPLLKRLLGAQAAYRQAQGALSEGLVDIVEGLRVLNAFGGKAAYAERYRTDSMKVRDRGFRVAGVTSWIEALAVGLPTVFVAGVTWLAARMAVEGSISVGQLVAVYGYAAILVVPVSSFIEGADQVSRAVVSARRLLRLLVLVPDQECALAQAGPPSTPAELHDVDSGVRIQPGRFSALASAHPEQAATVLERLAGFVPSAATWGGTPLGAIAPDRLHERILLADNNATLFAGSLRSVLQGRTDADDATLDSALRAACAEDITHQLRHGLAARVEQGATNFSGGQRQRLRLARALVAAPEVLLAVEPTSALDAPTEALVAERVRARRAGQTTVVTSSSPLLLACADCVYLLEDGLLVASGTHHELLVTNPTYRSVVLRDDDGAGEPIATLSAEPELRP